MQYVYKLKLSVCSYLHWIGDALSIAEYLVQIVSAQHVAQRGLCQQACTVMSILDVGDTDRCILDSIVDDRIDRNSDRIFGEHFLRRHVEGERSQVDLGVILNTRQYEEDAGSLGATV